MHEGVRRKVGVLWCEVGGIGREGDEAAVGTEAANSLLMFASAPLLARLARSLTPDEASAGVAAQTTRMTIIPVTGLTKGLIDSPPVQ